MEKFESWDRVLIKEQLDIGISAYVHILIFHGVETFESCQGGYGHAFPDPTIRFHGEQGAGWLALSVALDYGLPVKELRRTWSIENREPQGASWEMVFGKQSAENNQTYKQQIKERT